MSLSSPLQDELQPLLAAVQRNCDIADARHAGDYTLCIYLLKMREYFRWEKGYAPGEKLPEADVGDWLRARESHWENLEDQSFAELPLAGGLYDPFDNAALNALLNPRGLVYSGGLGRRGMPHFFIGRLGRRERRADCELLVAENEYARDLTAPPAMTLDGTILVRRESLRRSLWEKIEEWRWQKRDNATGRMLRCFGGESDPAAVLERMTDVALEAVLWHEQGEVLAGRRLGPDWEHMLAAVLGSKTELGVRAVRDHLADSLTTLPRLLDDEPAPLHFYFASLGPLARDLAPALCRAYEQWVAHGDRGELAALVPTGAAHWSALAGEMLDLYRQRPADLAAGLERLIAGSRW